MLGGLGGVGYRVLDFGGQGGFVVWFEGMWFVIDLFELVCDIIRFSKSNRKRESERERGRG